MQIWLDKYLADMGVGTRSQVKQHIRRKQVTVNGEFSAGPEQKVTPGEDVVSFQGQSIPYAQYEYYLFYKPKGCVSATTDNCHKTVLDYFPENRRKGLFPVGRLDIDTEGLLLITNDGALSHNLLAPGKHVPKTYYAEVLNPVTEEDIAQFAQGIDIGEAKPTRPAKLAPLPGEGLPTAQVELTVTEGKFHQVKRMFEAVGNEVLCLKRVSMGGLELDESLSPGEYRPLTDTELQKIRR